MFMQPFVLLCATVPHDVVRCCTACVLQGYATMLDTMWSTVMGWLVDHNVPIRTRVWNYAVEVALAGAGAPVNRLQLAILDLLREVTVPMALLIGEPLGVAALAFHVHAARGYVQPVACAASWVCEAPFAIDAGQQACDVPYHSGMHAGCTTCKLHCNMCLLCLVNGM